MVSPQPTISQSAPADRLRILAGSQGVPPGDLIESVPSFRQLEAKLWAEIRERMIAVAEDIRRCNPEAHPIFHHGASQPSTFDLVFRLLKHPLLVTTSELSDIFHLQQCHAATPPQADAAMVYYIRTFPILRSQLLTIIADWELSSRYYDTVPHWLNHLKSMKSDDTTLYIRYIGMTEGGKTAWGRFWDDIIKRKSGILAAFLGEIVNRYPDVLDNSTIHEVLSATYRDLPPTKRTPGRILDDRERVLIALFNRNVLLNQQPGGFYPTYTPLASDHNLYSNVKIDYFNLFGRSIDPQDVSAEFKIAHRLSRWSEKVKQFGLDHPDETLTTRFPMTDEYCQSVVKEQAHPRRSLLKGKPLMVLFGKDVTLEDFQGANTFLSGASRAGSLTVQLLGRLHQFESGFGEPQVFPFMAGQFPFVDLFNYVGHGDPLAQVQLARGYFEAVEPRIVVTFSRLVSAWTASNFIHPHGLPRFYYFKLR